MSVKRMPVLICDQCQRTGPIGAHVIGVAFAYGWQRDPDLCPNCQRIGPLPPVMPPPRPPEESSDAPTP